MDLKSLAISSLTSAAVAALVALAVSELRARFGDRRERHRKLKSLLFELLELRFGMVRADPHHLHEAISRFVRSRLGEAAAQELMSPEGQKFLTFLVPLAERLEKAWNPETYQRLVRQLAPLHPLLAYRLANMSQLPAVQQDVRDYFAALVKKVEELGWDATGPECDTAQSVTQRAVRREALEQLGEAIRLVAWQVGGWTRLRVGRILRRQTDVNQDELVDFLDEFIDAAINLDDETVRAGASALDLARDTNPERS